MVDALSISCTGRSRAVYEDAKHPSSEEGNQGSSLPYGEMLLLSLRWYLFRLSHGCTAGRQMCQRRPRRLPLVENVRLKVWWASMNCRRLSRLIPYRYPQTGDWLYHNQWLYGRLAATSSSPWAMRSCGLECISLFWMYFSDRDLVCVPEGGREHLCHGTTRYLDDNP